MLVGLRKRATYANVMATIAVFIALGGSSYAALTLTKHSVKGKHIAPRSVTSLKVKDGTLRARDFRAGVLEAPNPIGDEDADTLDGLDSADFLRSSEKAQDADLFDGMESADFLRSSGKAQDAALLDGLDSGDFLRSSGTAQDADRLDGLDSSDLRVACMPSSDWVYYGGVCWERQVGGVMTYEAASARCGALGGRLPLITEFYAVVNGGPFTPAMIVSNWAADATGDNEVAYINNPNQATDIDGVQSPLDNDKVRCVKPPLNALGAP